MPVANAYAHCVRAVTFQDLAKLAPSIRGALFTQCDGDWERVTIDADGGLCIYNNYQLAAAAIRAAKVRPATKPKPAGKAAPKAPTKPTTKPTKAAPTKQVPRPAHTPAPPRKRSPQAAALAEVFGSLARPTHGGVQVIAADRADDEPPGADIIYSGEPPAASPQTPDPTAPKTTDLVDATAVKFAEMLRNGLPESMQFRFHADVLALYGVDQTIMTGALRHPERVEVRPESRRKGYPILAFRRGDLAVILGLRTPEYPMVIAVYATSRLDADAVHPRGTGTGSGGARKQAGLPGTVRSMLKALKIAGAQMPDVAGDTRSVEISYKGNSLGKVTVAVGTPKQTVQSDYQRIIRKINAIDARA